MQEFKTETFFDEHLNNNSQRSFEFYNNILLELKELLISKNIELSDNKDYNGFLFRYGVFNKEDIFTSLQEKTTLILTINPGGKQKEGNNHIKYPKDYLGDHDIATRFKENAPIDNQILHLYSAIYKYSQPNNIKYESNNQYCPNDSADFIEFSSKNLLEATFLPFRTEKYNQFKFSLKHDEIINFFSMLWVDIISHADNLKRIIVLGWPPYNNITRILEKRLGYRKEKDRHDIESGWGRASISISKFSKNDKSLIVGRLPHLSSYKLFSREGCYPQINKFLEEMFS